MQRCVVCINKSTLSEIGDKWRLLDLNLGISVIELPPTCGYVNARIAQATVGAYFVGLFVARARVRNLTFSAFLLPFVILRVWADLGCQNAQIWCQKVRIATLVYGKLHSSLYLKAENCSIQKKTIMGLSTQLGKNCNR